MLEPRVCETKRFGVHERIGVFSELEEGLQLLLAIQLDVPIENGVAEVAENGGHE
jgi:hypothetical protein